jgi:hypothetical protein
VLGAYLQKQKKHAPRTIFFSNPKVSREELLKPHLERTAERVKVSDAKYILSIQDSVVLNYTRHKAKTEIGRIGKTGKTEQYGLIQHNTLCVTDRNEALGLLDIQHFHHDDFEVEIDREKRSVEAKKNICWIEASRNRRCLLKDSDKKVITVADRENDFFEFLHDLSVNNEDYCWVLLTDLSVETIEECELVIQMYKSRWHIEDFHKILKTGYQVDELYLHASRKAIENALTMASLSACRLYWLIYVGSGRVEESIKADRLFEGWEWKSLYVYFKEKMPSESPTLASVILKIARLGGYKLNKEAKPPGIKTMWIGFQSFSIAAQLYRNMTMSTKT